MKNWQNKKRIIRNSGEEILVQNLKKTSFYFLRIIIIALLKTSGEKCLSFIFQKKVVFLVCETRKSNKRIM